METMLVAAALRGWCFCWYAGSSCWTCLDFSPLMGEVHSLAPVLSPRPLAWSGLAVLCWLVSSHLDRGARRLIVIEWGSHSSRQA